MKRLFFLLPIVASSCGDAIVTQGLEEPFAVQGGQLVEGPLPGLPPEQPPSPPRPTAATVEATSLRPGLRNVAVFGWATLDAVSVAAQIEGQGRGHWVIPTGPPDPTVQGEPVRSWRFVADLHASLAPGRHRLLVAATDAGGKTGSQVANTLCVNRPVPDNGNACDPARPPPELVVSLTWDRPVDLDLVVVTPTSEIIGAKNPSRGLAADQKINRNALEKNAEGVGYLDRDANASCHDDGRPIESVVFPNKPAKGSYLVYVNLHDACAERSVHYTVARHTRGAGPQPGTFTVVETDRKNGTLVGLQANGSTGLGTFVTELFVE